jgi:NAD(P)-dependent dehydrogenase (short-subunit alcohol dehydrogenase family)
MGNKKRNMQKKNIIVTGGASGIGLAIVKRFALAGACVHVWDFNKEQGNQLEQDMQAQGYSVQFSEADVSKQKDVRLLADQIEGSLDVLINNAGISHVGALHHTSEEDFDRLYEVNVKGLYNCAYAVIPRMLEQQSGVIINMASVASVVGIPDRFA